MLRLRLCCVYVLAAAMAAAGAALCEDETSVALTLVYGSNTNGILRSCNCPGKPLGGLARRATVIDSLRRKHPHVLLLDAGDYFPHSARGERNPVILRAMEEMAYDAAGIGDQELSGGGARFRELTGESPMPIVCANVRYITGSDSTLLGQPYLLKEYAGVKIGVTGVLAPELLVRVRKEFSQGIEVLDPVQRLQQVVEELRDKTDLLVVLSHFGLDGDRLLAAEIPEINVVVGAHSKHLLRSPEIAGTALILHAGRNGEYVGVLHLQIADGSIVSSEDELIPLGRDVPDHAKVGALVEDYFDKRAQGTKAATSSSTPDQVKRVVLKLYLSQECDQCEDIKERFLPALVGKLGITLTVVDRDLDDPKVYEELVRTEQRLGDTDNEIPVIVLGNRIFGGEAEIRQELEQAIKSIIGGGTANTVPEQAR